MGNLAIDTSALSNIKPLLQQQQLQQAFNAQQAQAQQALQTGGIDTANKLNSYKAQTVLAAAAGGQPALDAAFSKLNAQGIDTSDYDPNVDNATKQANALLQAQVPLGSLLGLGLKAEGNTAQGVTAMGSVSGAKSLDPLSNIVSNALTNRLAGAAGNTSTPSVPVPSNINPPAVTSGPLSQPANQGSIPIPVKQPLSIDGSQDSISISPTPTQGAPIQTPQGNPAALQAVIPKFVPPAYNPDLSQSANQAAVENARKDYETNNAGAIEASKAQSGALGKDVETTNLDAIRSQQTNAKLQPNFQALRDINNDVPDNAYGIPAGVKEWLSSSNPYGDAKWATAGGLWKAVNEQQVLNTLAQLTAGGQIRPSRQIAKMLETGSFVPEDIPPEGRMVLINTMAKESQNSAISATNINSQLQGGSTQPYVQTVPSTGVNPPVLKAAFVAKQNNLPLAASQADFDQLQSGDKYVEPDGNIYVKP